jgi:hypothetical protein
MEARHSPSIAERAARLCRWAAGLAVGGFSVLLHVTAAFILLVLLMVIVSRAGG